MDRVIGIDLGTTNSVVAYYEQGNPVVIQNAEGTKTTPSVVLYKGPGEIVVGDLAKRQMVTQSKATVRSIKRFMGMRYSEITPEKLQGIAYDLVEGPNDSILIDVGWTKVTPEQVSAEILKKMRATAEEFFGEPVERAVVTVPAYFNDNQRAATKHAAEIAGLDVVRIINEPTAAALAYGVDKTMSQRIAVFDFGGGTLDVTILEIDKDVLEVKSTRGDTFLGGDNIDQAIYADAVRRFLEKSGVDLSADTQAEQRLLEASEKVKCELSTTTETLMSLPFIGAGPSGPLHYNEPFTRERLAELIKPLLPRAIECCQAAVVDAHLTPASISNVLLVGGSTRIPAVREVVRQFFGRDPNHNLNPDEAVAIGAAVQGSIIIGGLREVLLLDVTPLSLGIELSGGVFTTLISRNSSIPTAVHKTFTTVRDAQTSVRVHVLQGERKIAHENLSLGYFVLTGVTPAPKEIPEIDVCLQIDANGMLQVSATDVTSGASNSITIETVGRVSGAEAEALVASAESAAEDDRTFMRRAVLTHRAEEIMDKMQALLADERRVLELDKMQRVKKAIFGFDVARSRGDLFELEAAYELLNEVNHELTEDYLMRQYDQLAE